MSLLVGTTQGGRELGKVRVKSATATQLVVAENSDINWPSANHLTVQRYWEVLPVYPRIINDPNNVDDVIFYKDYDVAYTNQNTILGAFPCAGTHKAGFAGDSLYYSATGTTHLLASALTYDWAFEGGTPTGSSSLTPGYVSYPTAGDYVTRLKVTGANGSIDTTYRYVSIRGRPYTSVSPQPITNWTIEGLSGSRGEGGYNTRITITNTSTVVNDGDVVVIWADDWYGSTNSSLGGNSENNSKIFFVGHVVDGSTQFDYRNSSITFEVSSITSLMQKSEGFAVSVESHNAPSKWFQLLDMDSRRALYHYLKWHSTVLSVADFQFIGDDKKIQYFDSDRESIFDAVDNYMRGTLVGSVCADRQGKIWAEVTPPAYSNPTGSFLPLMEISKRDWIGSPIVTERKLTPLSYLEMGGIAYSGVTTGTYTAHIGASPGNAPHIRGTVERIQGLAITGQNQLNQLVGNIYANKTTKYPFIDFELKGNYRNFDIAPFESVDVNIAQADTNSGLVLHSPYLIDSMSWNFSPEKKSLLASIRTSALVTGRSGETITIPDIPDGGGYGGFDGGFGRFKPIGFPASFGALVSSLSGIRFWQGTKTVTSISRNSTSLGIGGYTVIAGDSTLVSNDPFWVTVLNTGLYLIHATVTCSVADVEYIRILLTTDDNYISGNGANPPKYIGETDHDYPITLAVSDVTAIYYLQSNKFIAPRVGWNTDSGVAPAKDLEVVLSIVKLG